MSSKTLAISSHAGRTTGAVIESSIGSMKIASVFELPADTAARLPVAGPFDRVVATIEAEAAAFRVLALPFRDRRRVSQAVGPALEEHVPYDLDEGILGWDFSGPAGAGSGSTVLATIAEIPRLEAARARIAALGIEGGIERLIWTPSAILTAYRHAVGEDASFTAVDIGSGGAVIARFLAGRVAALRIVAPCDEELLLRNTVWSLATIAAPEGDSIGEAETRLVVGGEFGARLADTLSKRSGLPAEALPVASPIEGLGARDWRELTALVGLILVAGGDGLAPVIDFEAASASLFGVAMLRDLQDELRPLLRWGAAALLLGIVGVTIDYVQLFSERRVLAKRAEQIYASAMPSPSGGVGRKVKMEMRLRELQGRADDSGAGGAGSPLSLLAAISRDVPKNLDVTVEQVEHLASSAKVAGKAASFETVTKMQEALQKGGAFASVEVKDVHTSVSGGGVDFLLELGTTTVEAGA